MKLHYLDNHSGNSHQRRIARREMRRSSPFDLDLIHASSESWKIFQEAERDAERLLGLIYTGSAVQPGDCSAPMDRP